METIPEHVVRDVCHELLQRFCSRPDIPKPVRIVRCVDNDADFSVTAIRRLVLVAFGDVDASSERIELCMPIKTCCSQCACICRSAWNSERFICGSYSYHKVGQSAIDCDVLAKPVPSETVSTRALSRSLDVTHHNILHVCPLQDPCFLSLVHILLVPSHLQFTV